MIKVILRICRSLNSVAHPWAIVGGANLLLRGCASSPNDIDIITTSQGVLSIAATFQSQIRHGPVWTESKAIKSNFCVANIESIKVEVMGDPINYIGGAWIANSEWKKHIEHIAVSESIVPVTTLNYEKRINAILQNFNRVAAIKECITRQTQPTQKAPAQFAV